MSLLIDKLVEARPELMEVTKPINLIAIKAADDEVLSCIERAVSEKRIFAYLIDDQAKLEEKLKAYKINQASYEIIAISDDQSAAFKAVELVRQGKGDAILKGHISTGKVLKEVVNKENGIKKADTLSHVAVLSMPTLDKLIAITDGGLVLQADHETAKVVIENAVDVMTALKVSPVKVSLLSAAENVIPKLPSSVMEADLTKDYADHSHIVVEGPLSIDISLSPASAKEKEYPGKVQGDADILFAPDIVTGNVASKALTLFGGSEMAGLIMGGQVPVIITSRSSSFEEKYASILLAQLIMTQQ
ncbi:phosphate acetyl/butyryl transferase [Streptococcus iniae]|uniref:phosphate acyltransferase n=1 Tax=Streptococcus iniae TaxID=1346 RepID=UPI0002F02C56|nr:phosphate acyltransferase [Streptococcus iniae]ESR08831.1 phosphate acetyl/butyryl transferase [Streptococcus iniae IUSA1]OHX26604.1 phosphate acetyl/butyryl transferase [Streptococcus iniae]RLV28351.1 phosphate acetyl/butyryl transferase [Streptococcus iniae]